ncbi:MAG TPA: HEAT repeat domain-containing protein, partial [Vicinamibacteria bacterium]
MPILPSDRKRIQELLARLESAAAAERESAVARLTLLGERVVPHLLSFLATASPTVRLAGVEVLERVGGPSSLGGLLPLTADPSEDVARRAIEATSASADPRAAEALRAVLSSGSAPRRQAAVQGLAQLHRRGVVEAVEPLLGLLLDGDEEETLRLEALASLSSLDRRSLLPALQTLAKDRSLAIAEAAGALVSRRAGARSTEHRLPDRAVQLSRELSRLTAPGTSPAEVQAIVATLVSRRSPALLPLLRRRLEALSAPAAPSDAESTARAKARIHLALGALGSRIALHDLREMLRARPPYAAHDLLAATDLVGDTSFVPALAALAADEPGLAAAAAPVLQAIVRRESLRRTSRVVTGLPPAHKTALEAL